MTEHVQIRIEWNSQVQREKIKKKKGGKEQNKTQGKERFNLCLQMA